MLAIQIIPLEFERRKLQILKKGSFCPSFELGVKTGKCFYNYENGRRIQTIYTPYSGSAQTSYNFYDPEEEFGEIGISSYARTFWRFDGPDGSDAVVDDNRTIYLNNDALGHSYNIPFSPYGPTKTAPIHNLISYAQMLSWHSRSMNPIGLIWMGARYYDPETGRFLSPDPVGLPINIDLYSYANGDPINFVNPDGRFASQAYQQLKAYTLSTFSNPRVQGGLRAFASSAEITAGTALTFSSAGWAAPVGGAIIAHGMDNFIAGTHQMFSGQQQSTATELLLQKTGMSAQKAWLANDWISFLGTLGGSEWRFQLNQNSKMIPKIYSHAGPGITSNISTSNPIWTSTKQMTSVENAFWHWKQHTQDFPGLLNATQYAKETKKFITTPPIGTLKKIRANGDIVLYNPATNNFAISNAKGLPRNMYKPSFKRHPYSTHLEYFNAQK